MATTRICAADGCSKTARYGSPYCSMHEARVRRHGSPNIGEMKARGKCSADGCDRAHYAKGWCTKHYNQWRLTGDPMPKRAKETPNGAPIRWIKDHAFFDRDECLIWPYSRAKSGYGDINGVGGAHRFMCEVAHGLPKSIGMHAAHNCGRGADGCVNPKHLRWATPIENARDRIIHGTSNRGEMNGQSKLTVDIVRRIRSLAGKMRQEEIADIFGVRRQAIGKIISRDRWGWVE